MAHHELPLVSVNRSTNESVSHWQSSWQWARASIEESDLSDAEWALVAPVLPPQKPKTGRPANDHRNTVNAILWVRRNGYPWRHLPSQYGCWSTAASRYHRWRKAGVWERVQAVLDRQDRQGSGNRDGPESRTDAHAALAVAVDTMSHKRR